MRHVLRWTTLIMVCWMAGAAAAEAPRDARLLEAQATLDEAAKLRDAGSYSEALARIGQALTLREAVLGSTHPDVATCLHLMGDIYRRRGDLAHAESLFQRAITLREAALGENDLLVAQSLNALAAVYFDRRLFGQAELLFQRALAIREAALGNNHPDVAQTLNNLASLYTHQGLYGRAEPLVQRALAIYETVLGESHPRVGRALNTLAVIYEDMGLYSRAEPLLQRALAISEAALGNNHPDAATLLSNLAALYKNQGLYGRAEPLNQRALAIREEAFGKSHPNVAQTLSNLAVVYLELGLYGQAEPLLQRALAIYETVLGKSHPDVANALNNLGKLYWEQGLYSRAEPLLQRALAIGEAAFGKNSPNVADGLNHLAMLRLAQHRLTSALPLFTRSFAISEQRLRQEALDFSESRLASFLQYLREAEKLLYALLREHPKNVRVQRLALGAVLLRKGRSAEETASISRTLYRSLGTEDRDAFERLRGLRTQLAAASFAGPGSLTPEAYQQRLKTLAGEGDSLEADLARRSAILRSLTTLPSPAEIADRVAASLPKDGALVEFVAYRDSPLVPKPGTPRAKKPGQLRYLALLLFPDTSTRAVDLGPAEPIDGAASRLRDVLANREASFQATAQELYQRAFQPLRPLLGNTRRVFLSPDGQLGLVPFAALHDGRRFLVDSFDFIYLTSGRELLPRPQEIAPASPVFVLADPDLNASPLAAPPASGNPSPLTERSASLEHVFATLRTDLSPSAWVPLPGTRQEAEAIQRLLPQARLFLGPEATKERLLQLPTPGILHLATHGFFLEDAPTPAGSRAVGQFGALGDNPRAPRPREPLLRSGLALAGARAPAPDASTPSEPRPEASLVTALELAGLDLWGTQLVVLSACDTGRGDVKLGQGVYGLRRSLAVAGAETVVMSLWKVNDDSTRLLMEGYYRNLLAGQGRASALREAMRSFRVSQPHPHYWAPFIAQGSDEPLRALAPLPQPPPGE